ncbi:MAG: adenine deaminase [Actinobacteria bacterium]|nr:adenine deaminase [Actinomycetota bacterium]
MDYLADLISVARGVAPAELVLRNAQVLNLFNGALESTSVAIHRGVVAGLGKYSGLSEIDLKGSVVVPGFIDSHTHIESTLLRPEELARVLVSHGTTTLIAEPHEIANVTGRAGLEYLTETSAGLPIDIFFMAPSSVPSTSPELETNGALLDLGAVKELLNEPSYIGLGEVMDYPKVIAGESGILDKIRSAKGRSIDGHCPGLTGFDLNAYLAAGPSTDHEATELKEAMEKISRGVELILRQSSVSKDFDRLVPLVNYITARRCLLATDDRTAIDLETEGGIDMLLRMAIEREIDPRLAVQMVTLNPAEHYGLIDRGSVSPGKIADLVILEDLTSVYIRMVFKGGLPIYDEGKLIIDVEAYNPPEAVLNTVRVSGVKPADFEIAGEDGAYRVIGYRPGLILTDTLIEPFHAEKGRIPSDLDRDILHISVINRYAKDVNVSNGLLNGFGLKRGAIASSVSHDAHNIAVAGVDSVSMSTAVNAVIKSGGGMSAALDDAVLAELPLEIAGLMSLAPYPDVILGMRGLREAAAYLGTELEDPFIALSFMTLAVVPSLKITDKGLVDVPRGKLVDLFIGREIKRAA